MIVRCVAARLRACLSFSLCSICQFPVKSNVFLASFLLSSRDTLGYLYLFNLLLPSCIHWSYADLCYMWPVFHFLFDVEHSYCLSNAISFSFIGLCAIVSHFEKKNWAKIVDFFRQNSYLFWFWIQFANTLTAVTLFLLFFHFFPCFVCSNFRFVLFLLILFAMEPNIFIESVLLCNARIMILVCLCKRNLLGRWWWCVFDWLLFHLYCYHS